MLGRWEEERVKKIKFLGLYYFVNLQIIPVIKLFRPRKVIRHEVDPKFHHCLYTEKISCDSLSILQGGKKLNSRLLSIPQRSSKIGAPCPGTLVICSGAQVMTVLFPRASPEGRLHRVCRHKAASPRPRRFRARPTEGALGRYLPNTGLYLRQECQKASRFPSSPPRWSSS